MADANMYIMNPVFQAESFNEMVQPLALYAQAYKEQEAKVEDMTDKAAALEWIANQNPDSQTAALYRDMSAKIKGIRDDMMINGLQGGTRSRILGARRMYSANSAEITRRYEDMQKYQQRMEQLYDKDNSIVFSPESQNVSLDDFAGGKRPQIKAISGNEIMARGAAVGKRLTSQIFGDGVVGQEMGGQFWKTYQEQGMTDKALWNALDAVGKGDSTHFQMAKQVIDGVYNSFKDFSPYDQQRLKDRFIEGVYSGSVYNRQVDYKQNLNFESDAARDTRLFQKRMAENQDRRAQGEYEVQMTIAGAKKNPDGTWDTSGVINPYGKAGSGNSSSSGSGGTDGRMKRHKTKYMTGNDVNWSNAVQKDGHYYDVSGEQSVQRGESVKFKKDGNKIYAMCNGVIIATYNTSDRKLEEVQEHNKVLNALSIPGNPFKKNNSKYYWRKSDDKLLRKLCQEAADIIDENNGNINALNNYEFRFQSDGTDAREFFGRGNNGSIFIENLDEEMPSTFDIQTPGQGNIDLAPAN